MIANIVNNPARYRLVTSLQMKQQRMGQAADPNHYEVVGFEPKPI